MSTMSATLKKKKKKQQNYTVQQYMLKLKLQGTAAAYFYKGY